MGRADRGQPGLVEREGDVLRGAREVRLPDEAFAGNCADRLELKRIERPHARFDPGREAVSLA